MGGAQASEDRIIIKGQKNKINKIKLEHREKCTHTWKFKIMEGKPNRNKRIYYVHTPYNNFKQGRAIYCTLHKKII